jgi:hypothetical protein
VQKPKKVTAQKLVKQLNECGTTARGKIITAVATNCTAKNTFTFYKGSDLYVE